MAFLVEMRTRVKGVQEEMYIQPSLKKASNGKKGKRSEDQLIFQHAKNH